MAPTDLANHLGSIVLSVGALGTAAFGLVDIAKFLPNGGISNAGFAFIEAAVRQLLPDAAAASMTLDNLHGNWINGRPLEDQKAIAKSLLKLQLSPATANGFAAATQVDAAVLAGVAGNMTTGASLTPEQINVLGRFDLTLTAMLDAGYQHADQRYRNASKFLAMILAVLLALFGGWAISSDTAGFFGSAEMWQVIVCGLLATPLAPISKDLASALQAGVKVAQAVKG